MAHYTESEATYCSDLEKEDKHKIRRSKRLSQKYMRCNFRSNKNLHIERLNDIYRMLKCGMLCSKWARDDWQALQFEVDLIKKTLKGKPYNKFSFISKKIDENLQYSNPSYRNESPIELQNVELEKSPNILAGMMSEVLTEIPPYQPKDLPNIETAQSSKSSTELTQKNALDLTKKNIQIPSGLHKNLSQQDITERNKPQENVITVIAEVLTTQPETARLPQAEVSLNSKELMIDLTEEVPDDRNLKNIAPVMESRTRKPKSPVHVSKWLQYLPTQDRPTINIEKPKVMPTRNVNNHPKSIKDSIIKLYKDQPSGSKGIQNNKQNPSTGGYSNDHKQLEKSNSAQNRSRIIENSKPKPLRNTQNILRRDSEFSQVAQRTVQSEQFCSRSPDFLLEEFLKLTTPDANDNDNDSVESFSPSLKDSFKKVFGTDSLREVFGCEEVVYNLKESHVKRLAKAINVEHGTLKKTIEEILLNDSCGIPEDDIMRSDSSVIECSQSPPQRLFSSQRSQVSK